MFLHNNFKYSVFSAYPPFKLNAFDTTDPCLNIHVTMKYATLRYDMAEVENGLYTALFSEK